MRTDLQIVQLPPTPTLVKGKVINDPNFGSKLSRISDENDSPAESIKTADNAGAGLWNRNSTLFMAKATGGAPILYQFNPSTMLAKVIPFTAPGNSDWCFSRINPAALFILSGAKILRYTFFRASNGDWTQGAAATVADFSSLLPFTPKWHGSFMMSQDDKVFTIAFSDGVQNTAFLVPSFHLGIGYRLLNTSVGMISGAGVTGPALLNSPKMKFPLNLHEAVQSPNPNYAIIHPDATSSQAFWDLPTLDINDPNTSGHAALGYLHQYDGNPGGGGIDEIDYATLAVRSVIPKNLLPAGQNPPQVYAGDQHFAFGAIDKVADHSIVWVSSQSQIYPFTSCWMNEVRGARVSDGVVFRACHTFNSGLSKEFDVANAIAVPSQDGKFVAFVTDWEESWGGRGDVVVVEVSH